MKPRVVQEDKEQNKKIERARKCAAARARLADLEGKLRDEWARISPGYAEREALALRSAAITARLREIDGILKNNRRPGVQRDLTQQEKADLIDEQLRLQAEKDSIERKLDRLNRERRGKPVPSSPELRRLDSLKEEAERDIEKYCPPKFIGGTSHQAEDSDQTDKAAPTAGLARKLKASEKNTTTADTLLKPVADITQAEIEAVMDDPAYWREHRPEAVGKVGDWFAHVWGEAPVGRDAAGRGMPAAPVNPPPAEARPLATPDGQPVDAALAALGGALDRLARRADDPGGKSTSAKAGNTASFGAGIGAGETAAVQALQRGLNLAPRLSPRQAPHQAPHQAPRMAPRVTGSAAQPGAPGQPGESAGWAHLPLKIDGDLGNKTRNTARAAAVRLGLPKLQEGLALGDFQGFAEGAADAARNPAAAGLRPGDLGQALSARIGPLFRERPRPAVSARMPVTKRRPAPEAAVLQETLNDLWAEPPSGTQGAARLKVDGIAGPKTEAAFLDTLRRHGPERVTGDFGRALGFLDPDGFDRADGAGGFGGSGGWAAAGW